MATVDYWSHADLDAIAFGGLIREDVMDQIFQIDEIPLPFTNLMGSDSTGNKFTSWTIDTLAAQDLDNAEVDGADSTKQNAKGGSRVGNQHQISTKHVQVTQRADASDTIGRASELAYQVMQRQKELRRDVEGIMLSQQGSVADDGDTVAGLSGSFPAWLTTNAFRGVGGADGGFNFATGIVDAPTVGTIRPLTETLVRDAAEAVYNEGGNPSTLMSIPTQIRKLSEFMFTSSARIATLQADQGIKPQTAVGSTNVFLTDFGVTLAFNPNRLQPTYNTDTATDALLIDPGMVRMGFLHGYQTAPLAKVGLSDRRQMSVDWTLKVLNEAAHAVIADLDFTAPVTL